MTGKLKTKGNMMFATKLDGVLKASTHHSAIYGLLHSALTVCSAQAAKTKAKL